MNLVHYLTQGQSVKTATLSHQKPAKEALVLASKSLLLGTLLELGGALRWPVVCGEEVETRRLWELAGQIDLSLGQRASHLLQCLQGALQQDQRLRLPQPNHDNGEIFFYHALYLHVEREGSLPRFAAALRRASPLTRLLSCPVMNQHGLLTFADGHQGEPAITREEAEALARHPATAFSIAHIADQWSLMPPPSARLGVEYQLERLRTRRATLQLFFRACVDSGKWSRLLAFAMLFSRLQQVGFLEQIREVLEFAQWRFADREELLLAADGFYQQRIALEAFYQEHIIAPGPYGWSHPLEARIFLSRFEPMWIHKGLGAQLAEAQLKLRANLG